MKKIKNIYGFMRAVTENGGASFNIVTEESNPDIGFMVATKGNEVIIPVDYWNRNKINIVQRYIEDHYHFLLASEDYFLGGWINKGNVVLDVSMWVADKGQALIIGNENNQQAIYDCYNQIDIKLNNK